jgi:hypothetical protein
MHTGIRLLEIVWPVLWCGLSVGRLSCKSASRKTARIRHQVLVGGRSEVGSKPVESPKLIPRARTGPQNPLRWISCTVLRWESFPIVFRCERLSDWECRGLGIDFGFTREFPEPDIESLWLGYGCPFGLGLFAPDNCSNGFECSLKTENSGWFYVNIRARGSVITDACPPLA